MACEFEPGDTVYSRDGQKAQFVTPHNGAFIVQLFYSVDDDDPDGESYPTQVAAWDQVYEKPPREVYDAETVQARERLAALHRDIDEVHRQQAMASRERQAVLQRLTEFEALRYLDDLLNAKITHYVTTVEGRWVVLDSEAYRKEKPGGSNTMGLRLIVNTWESGVGVEKRLRWICTGNDTSSGSDVMPFPSQELALTKVREIIAKGLLEQVQQVLNGYTYDVDKLLKSAKEYGVPVPAKLTEAMQQRELAKAEAELKAATTALENAQARAVKARAPFANPSPTA